MTPAPLLPEPAILARQLRRQLPDWGAVEWRHETTSTNSDLLAAASSSAAPQLFGVHMQHGGRGRAGRNFRARPGDALMFSCAFTTTLPLAALPTLSIAFGVAAYEAVAALLPAGHRLRLKWPNDLQWDSAKLAGLLTETTSGTAAGIQGRRIVVGVGLNLRGANELSLDLGRTVADWQATRSPALPADIVTSIAALWHDTVKHAEKTWSPDRGLADLAARYARCDALHGLPVTVQDQGEIQLEGKADGIEADGRLRVLTPQGLRLVHVGDISVRTQE